MARTFFKTHFTQICHSERSEKSHTSSQRSAVSVQLSDKIPYFTCHSRVNGNPDILRCFLLVFPGFPLAWE